MTPYKIYYAHNASMMSLKNMSRGYNYCAIDIQSILCPNNVKNIIHLEVMKLKETEKYDYDLEA